MGGLCVSGWSIGGAAQSLGFKARRRSIGLTALIDVVFILLLFFMLTSSFSRWHAVDMHPLVTAASVPELQNQVVFLYEDLSLVLQSADHRLDHYSELSEVHAHWFQAGQPVILVPQGDVSLQSIMSCLDVISGLGVASVNYGGAMAAREAQAD